MKVQCPNIQDGENVHKHSCYLCKGKQHIPILQALKWKIGSNVLLLDSNNKEISFEVLKTNILNMAREYLEEWKYDVCPIINYQVAGSLTTDFKELLNNIKLISLPKEYEVVMITYIGQVRTSTGCYKEELVTRKAFYSKSSGYYDKGNRWIDTPDGYFSIPRYWRDDMPNTFYHYPRVLPENVIKWRLIKKPG